MLSSQKKKLIKRNPELIQIPLFPENNSPLSSVKRIFPLLAGNVEHTHIYINICNQSGNMCCASTSNRISLPWLQCNLWHRNEKTLFITGKIVSYVRFTLVLVRYIAFAEYSSTMAMWQCQEIENVYIIINKSRKLVF